MPFGLLTGVAGLLVLYVGLQTVSQGVLGAELANNTEVPLAAVATEVLGGWGGKMLLVGVVISIFSSISGDMLGSPWVIFASSLAGHLPKRLSKLHPKYNTPHVAIIFFATLVCAFALSGTFKYSAVFSTGALLLIYLGVSLTVIRLLLQIPIGEALSIAGLIGASAVARARPAAPTLPGAPRL